MLPRYIFPARSINEFVFRLLIFSACPCKAGRREKNKFRAPLFSLYAARDRGRRRGKAFSPLFSRAVSAYFQKCEKKGVPFFEKSGPPANFFRFFSEISAAVPENIPRFGGTLSEKVALLFFISLHERFYPFSAGFFISCGASAYNRRN